MIRFVRRLLVFSLLFTPLLASATVVRDIRVAGNQRIEQAAVETYLAINRGDDISRYDLDLALKKLYDTGFFADAGIDIDTAGVVQVQVVENPSINQVLFEGNDQIDTKDLEAEITLRGRSIYTRTKVQNDLKRLLDVYRRNGRYSAQITPQIIELEQNRVNLVYNIVEGPRAFIQKITFIGNASYDSKTLEKVINSSAERWYKFLSDSDRYDPDRLQYDQELLRRFYLENGYADFKIKSALAELSPQRDAFYLTFTVEEGEKYRFGKIDVQSKLKASGRLPDFGEAISTKTGQTYNASEVEDSINRMVDTLSDTGFAFVDINPKTERRTVGKQKLIDLTYDIVEGPKVYVDRINIFGNQRTLDEVVRRELRLTEGDAYSSSKLKRSEQRLKNLNYFEKVDVQTKPGPTPDTTAIDVNVAEKSTGEITFGAGFSTADGPLADIGVTENNFLGRGQQLRAHTIFAARRQMYDLGFTEPYFLGRPVEAGFDVYRSSIDYQDQASYNRDATGALLKFSYSLSEKLKHQLRYNYELTDITDVDDDASIYIQEQEGQNSASIVGQSFIYDDRDNRIAPTSGYYWRISQDLAGLGGDDRFIRHEAQAEYYYPLAKKWTFLLSGSAGNITGIGKDVRINQRFYIGSEEIRGFSRAGIGARDASTSDALGGNNYYAGTAEVRFPLGLSDDLGVTGDTFVDVGSLWGVDSGREGINDSAAPRAAAGFGVVWTSPFGPIRLDFAKALVKQDYDDEELVRFSFGTRF